MVSILLITTSFVVIRDKLTAPTYPDNEQFRMAKYLLHGRSFVCPVGPERDDPSSWYAPGYIALMSGIMGVFGEATPTSMAVIRFSNILAMSLALELFFLVGCKLFGVRIA